MASPAKIADKLPETLPETFDDWDLEDSPDAPQEGSADPKQPEQQAAHDHTLTSYTDFGEFFRDQKAIDTLVDRLRTRASESRVVDNPTTALQTADPIPDASVKVATNTPAEDQDIASDSRPVIPWKTGLAQEKKANSRRLVMIGGASLVAILVSLGLIFPAFNSGRKSVAEQVPHPITQQASPDQQVNTSATTQGASLTPVKTQTPGKQQQASTSKDARQQGGSSASQVKSNVLNDQSAEPSRISQDVKKRFAENSPPPELGIISAEGMAGSSTNPTIFNGNSQTVVQVSPKSVDISAGVASGMLIRKTTPKYPQIAQTAHISGTVQMHAVISKTGSIKDLRVLSGPALLRQAAVDAVRTWLYKPYLLDNQPTEVETTINVVFAIGR